MKILRTFGTLWCFMSKKMGVIWNENNFRKKMIQILLNLLFILKSREFFPLKFNNHKYQTISRSFKENYLHLIDFSIFIALINQRFIIFFKLDSDFWGIVHFIHGKRFIDLYEIHFHETAFHKRTQCIWEHRHQLNLLEEVFRRIY